MQRSSLLWQVTKAKCLPVPSAGPIWKRAEDGKRCGLPSIEGFCEMNPGDWDNLT